MGVLAPFAIVAFLTTLLAENMHTAKARIRALSDRAMYTDKEHREPPKGELIVQKL